MIFANNIRNALSTFPHKSNYVIDISVYDTVISEKPIAIVAFSNSNIHGTIFWNDDIDSDVDYQNRMILIAKQKFILWQLNSNLNLL